MARVPSRHGQRPLVLSTIGRDARADLAVAIIAIAAVLDPEAIILGGGTAAKGEEWIGELRRTLKGELWREPNLVLAELGVEAQLYGAISGAKRALEGTS